MITGTTILENPHLWRRLAGAFFHRIGDDGRIQYQGHVLKVSGKHLHVEYFEWLTGGASNTAHVSRLELERYRFYDSSHDMVAAHRRENRSRGGDMA